MNVNPRCVHYFIDLAVVAARCRGIFVVLVRTRAAVLSCQFLGESLRLKLELSKVDIVEKRRS